MFVFEMNTQTDDAAMLDFIRSEREKSVSVREWKHRLMGYGYTVRNTDHGDVILKLGSREELCEIPDELMH
ncbi:MAG: hypothetical protein JXR13_16710 [Thalassovita sp.]